MLTYVSSRFTYEQRTHLACGYFFGPRRGYINYSIRENQFSSNTCFVNCVILAKDCGPLSVPVNGSSSGQDTTFPNVILFSCDVGFIMFGSQMRRCQSNGIWSGNVTSCKGVVYV